MKISVLTISVPLFILLFELLMAIIPTDTFFMNRFFINNRALDYPEVFKKDEKLFWRLRPSQTIKSQFFEILGPGGLEYGVFSINSNGMRGREIPEPSEKIRIVAMGNSCTFGWRTPEELIFVRQLESKINADSTLPIVEVINAGIPGYSSFQGSRFYISDIAALKPDILLVMFGWNDQWLAADNIPDKDQQFPPQTILDIQNNLSRLKIYTLMRKIILSATEVSLEEKLNWENPVCRVSFKDFYVNLHIIAHRAKEESIHIIFLTSPIPSLEKYYPQGHRTNMHQFHNYYNLQTRILAANTGSILIDAALKFDKYNNLFDDARRDPIHFNARGHRLIADQIYRYFRDNPDSLSKRKPPLPPDKLTRNLRLDDLDN